MVRRAEAIPFMKFDSLRFKVDYSILLSALMTAGGAFEFCKPLWIFSFWGILTHADLLWGNAVV